MSRTRPLDTEESRQQLKTWWNAEMLTHSGLQRTRDKDEQEQADTEAKGGNMEQRGEGQDGGKGGKGSKEGQMGAKEAAAAQWKGSWPWGS